jgi:hypothetical protein
VIETRVITISINRGKNKIYKVGGPENSPFARREHSAPVTGGLVFVAGRESEYIKAAELGKLLCSQL